MTTPVQDPSFQPGASVYGSVIPGMASFGEARMYPQRGVFGTGYFGGEVPGVCMEDEVLKFIEGAPVPRVKGPWPVTPDMGGRLKGHWGKRAIFYSRGGTQVIRRMTPYDASPKAHLTQFYPKYREAVALWKTFPVETKAQLNARAAALGKRCSGFNHWIALWIKDKPERLKYLP